jgi:hypothetical protein
MDQFVLNLFQKPSTPLSSRSSNVIPLFPTNQDFAEACCALALLQQWLPTRPSARVCSCCNTAFVRKSSLAKSISVCSPKIAPLGVQAPYTTLPVRTGYHHSNQSETLKKEKTAQPLMRPHTASRPECRTPQSGLEASTLCVEQPRSRICAHPCPYSAAITKERQRAESRVERQRGPGAIGAS